MSLTLVPLQVEATTSSLCLTSMLIVTMRDLRTSVNTLPGVTSPVPPICHKLAYAKIHRPFEYRREPHQTILSR